MRNYSGSKHLQLVGATMRASQTVIEKSASAAPAQQELLQAGWPQPDEQITKTASLARILATGLMVEEAEASMAE